MKIKLHKTLKKTFFILFFLYSFTLTAQCPIAPESILIDGDDEIFLSQCFGNNNPTRGTLLFRASRDGMSASTFHTMCDDKGPTIVIYKNANTGEVFGGYNPKSWNSSWNYNYGMDAFLFNLTYNYKLNQIDNYGNYQTYNGQNYFPTFGGGHDLYVNDGGNSGYCNPYSYENPNIAGHSYLAGDYNFTVSDIEVYSLVPSGIKASGPTTICSGESVTLSATGGDNYLWSNGSTTSSINVNQSGEYSVVISNVNSNCASVTYSKNVTVASPLNLVTTQTNVTQMGLCDGTVALIPSGGVLPYNQGTGLDFSGNVINTNALSFGGSGAVFTQNGVLSMTGVSNNWDNYVYTNNTTPRTPGKTFQGKFKADANTYTMIGWHNSSTNPYYTEMSHALYVAGGNNFYIYEHGQYVGYYGGYSVSEWYDFKIELQDVGAKYYVKSVNTSEWTLLATTYTYSDTDLRMGLSFYGYSYYGGVFQTDEWSGGAGMNPPLEGLCVGDYTYTISDAIGCVTSQTVSIIENALPLEVSLNKTCRVGEQSFDLNAIVTGGSAPYTYTWSQPTSSTNLTAANANVVVNANQNSAIATIKSNYVSGSVVNYIATVSLTITDALGHSIVSSINISSSKGAMGFNTMNLMTINPSCGNTNSNGSIYFKPTGGAFGGAGVLSYIWFNADNNSPITGATTANLVSAPAGNYYLKTTDANGCTSVSTNNVAAFTIPLSLITFQESIVKPTSGQNNGSICINNVVGGVSPYQYSWTYPDVYGSNNCLSNLGVVSQYLKVKDKNGCAAKKAISTKSMMVTSSNDELMENEEVITMEENVISVYPNPISDKLNINTLGYSSSNEGKYVMYNMQGQIISSGILNSGEVKSHEMGEIVSGMYIVKVIFDNDQRIFNIVKQ
jgi:hypothetical protein